MKKSSMKATTLRGLLIFILVVLVGGIGAGYYFGHQWIENYSSEVATTVVQSNDSNDDVAEGKRLQAEIADQQQTIAKVNQLFSDPSTYQTQVVNDVTNYASALGLPAPDFSFGSTSTGSTPTAGTTATAATTGTTVTVTLPSPIDYTTLLKLVRNIEQNLPKMQIAGLNLTRSDDQKVATDALTIQVFTK